MERLDASRNLLFGLLALKMGVIDLPALTSALLAWTRRKEVTLARLLIEQQTLSAGKHLIVAEACAEVLAAYNDDACACLASLGTFGSVRSELKRIDDAGLHEALACLDAPSPTPVDDLFATQVDPLATVVPRQEPDPYATVRESVRSDTWAAPSSPANPTIPSPSDLHSTLPDVDPLSTVVPSHPHSDDPYATQAAVSTELAPPGVTTVRSAANGSYRDSGGPGASPYEGASRYRSIRSHAKGGLGEVFVAIDEELGREVALKEIQERHADSPDSRDRFLLEAEVTGGLEHPGIVPVYGLGRYLDGRPYYAMRFIRGQPFKDAIDAFHEAEKTRRDPGIRALELRQLLGQFIDVCNALEYAHSRGIIHRDIKPANIMLGAFGETLVVDWGLAKALDRPEERQRSPTELPLLRPLSGGSSETLFGSTIGTPHYMSPEQAAGLLDRLGPSSDIYSLGATLYCLLTGQTPIQERTVKALLDKVQKGDFPPPRAIDRRVPPALEAVCLKAMALRPEDRYASARALAEDIEHWLADEPVSVYREPWTTRLARWSKRHKTLVTTTSALFLSGVVALAVFTVLIQREQARTERNYLLARSAVDQMLTELGAVDLVDVPQMEPVRKVMLTKALDFYKAFLNEHEHDRTLRRETGRAHIRLGDILEMLGDYAGAESNYDDAIDMLKPLVPKELMARADLAAAWHNLGMLLKKSNRFSEAEPAFRAARDLRKLLVEQYPQTPEYVKDEKDSVYQLGALLARLPGRSQEVESSYLEAIEAESRLAAQHPDQPDYRRKLARYRNNLGIFRRQIDPRAARAEYDEALKIHGELASKYPAVAAYQWEVARTLSNLGVVEQDERDLDGAERSFTKAHDKYKELTGGFPTVPDYRQELATVDNNLGMLLLRRNRPQEAETHLRAALASFESLVKAFPNRPDFRQRLAITHRNLGIFQFLANHDVKESESEFQNARKRIEQLIEEFPDVPEYHSDLGQAIDSVVNIVKDNPTRRDDALRLLNEAIQQQKLAINTNPRNVVFRQYLVTDYLYLEAILGQSKDGAAAAKAAEAILSFIPDEPKAYYVAARLLALAANLQNTGAPAGSDAGTPVSVLCDRALQRLREAVEKGFGRPEDLDHRSFNILRDRKEFQSLQQILKEKGKSAVG